MSSAKSPVLITDTKYRSSLSAVQALGELSYPIYAVQTEKELAGTPPAFSSKYVKEARLIAGSFHDAEYPGRLKNRCLEILQQERQRPVLFPVGAFTLAQLAEHPDELAPHADFLVSPPEILDRANDKRAVAELALSLGVPVPLEYGCSNGRLPAAFPVVVKPRCGEKLGLHAEERYRKANDEASFRAAYASMAKYDPAPVVQELLEGDGVGVSFVMDRESRPVSVVCHRRIREYPISGGPSACCESIWDQELVEYGARLLSALHFTGIAMVEFKGGKLLEINPRIWGSFPLTYKAGSPFAVCYVRAAQGEVLPLCTKPQYKLGVRMHFLLNDGLACLSYIRHGETARGLCGLGDIFNPRCKEALFSKKDAKPFFSYLGNTLKKRGN